MTEAPRFFMPEITPDKQESAYINLAQWCDEPTPELAERIYSIIYMHNSEEWTATVGKPLQGVSHRSVRSRGKKNKRTLQLTDPAIVLAIFPGNPFKVVTNHGIPENVHSKWANPFLVGQPSSIIYFSVI